MRWPHPFQTYQPQQLIQHLRDELQPVLLPEHQTHQTSAEQQAQGKQSRLCSCITEVTKASFVVLLLDLTRSFQIPPSNEERSWDSDKEGLQSSHSQGFL